MVDNGIGSNMYWCVQFPHLAKNIVLRCKKWRIMCEAWTFTFFLCYNASMLQKGLIHKCIHLDVSWSKCVASHLPNQIFISCIQLKHELLLSSHVIWIQIPSFLRWDHFPLRSWPWKGFLYTCLRFKRVPHINFMKSHGKQARRYLVTSLSKTWK